MPILDDHVTLVVVDAQVGFVDDAIKTARIHVAGDQSGQVRQVVDNISYLVRVFSERGLHIVMSRFINEEGSAFDKAGWKKMREGTKAVGYAFEEPTADSLSVRLGRVKTFTKHSFDIWEGLDLDAASDESQNGATFRDHVNGFGLGPLVFCGLDTSACVAASVHSTFARNDLRVVVDACADSSGPEFHVAALKLLDQVLLNNKANKFVTTEALVSQLPPYGPDLAGLGRSGSVGEPMLERTLDREMPYHDEPGRLRDVS